MRIPQPESISREQWQALIERSYHCPYLRGAITKYGTGVRFERALCEAALALSASREDALRQAAEAFAHAAFPIVVKP